MGDGSASAAVQDDGSVFTGDPKMMVAIQMQSETICQRVRHVVGNRRALGTGTGARGEAADWAFAAVKNDGSFISWGSADSGGDSNAVQGQLTSGVRHVVAERERFCSSEGGRVRRDLGTRMLWRRRFFLREGALLTVVLESEFC